jgi:hypothetical protein
MTNVREKIWNFLVHEPMVLVALICCLPFLISAAAVLGYQDYQVISTPGNPASGFDRFFVNSSGIGCLTSGGANCLPGFSNPMTTKGDIIVGGTSGVPARLAVGTNGQMLYSNSSATNGVDWEAPISLTTTGTSGAATFTPGNPNVLNVPNYSAGGGGGLTQISQNTLAMAAASVTFSSISAGFTNLYMTFNTRSSNASSADNFYIQFNSDTGSNYVLNFGDFGSGYSGGISAASATAAAIGTAPGTSSLANFPASGSCLLVAYANTTFTKNIVCNHNFVQGATTSSMLQGQYSSNWNSTSAINAIVIKLASGANFVAGSTFTLYGQQ